MSWVLAAEGAEPDDPTGASPACLVPAGTAHALDPAAGVTACGRPAAGVQAFPELTWPPAGMAAVDVCEICAERVASARPAR